MKADADKHSETETAGPADAGPASALVRLTHGRVPGRVRFRTRVLYRTEAIAELLQRRLAAEPTIRRVEINTLTGSVLILYSPATDLKRISELLRRTLAELLRLPVSSSARAQHRDTSRPANVTFIFDYLRRIREEEAVPDPGPDTQSPLRAVWHATPLEQVMRTLETERVDGLSTEEAARRLARYGGNVLAAAEPRSRLEMLASQFVSLPVLLLGVSAGVAVLTGGVLDAAVIGAVVLINAGIGLFTESYAEKTINALTRTETAEALVLRDGSQASIPSDRIVPGDVLALLPGHQVPADARLLRTQRLTIDESALTGESVPVGKSHEFLGNEDTPLGDRENMVYMGTYVTGGSGLALVVATGTQTEIGHIQSMVGETRTPETPMQRQLNAMGTQLALLSAAVCAGVFVVGLLRGYSWLEMLKSSISLAVAAVPEGLPAVATSTLALGMQTMRRHKVLVRRLDAVETLGSVQVICLDKTGTLTRNRMTVVDLRVANGQLLMDEGRFVMGETGIEPQHMHVLDRLLQIAVLCNESEPLEPAGSRQYQGSPTENALLEAAEIAGIDIRQLRAKHPLESMRYRSEQHAYMRTFHRTPSGGRLMAVKGSPDQVLALCRWTLRDGEPVPLTDADREAALRDNEAMAGNALRVLGIAWAESDGDDIPGDGLIWLGLVGMTDPVRTGMTELMETFHSAGIDTVMITGDQSATAYAIGKQLRLADSRPLQILDSNRLDRMDADLLSGLVQQVHVFSRVSPAHKLKIVQALQKAGKVVAMTGDGINDSPALRAANIGVAMGEAGTEAARNTSDVILEDDNLHTMVTAVEQGRTIYANIRKAIHFLLATNFSEIEVMLAAIALGLGQPLNPMQLLWINLITDIFPGLALALDPPERDILKQPPRDPQEPIIRRRDLARMGLESAVISTGALASYGYGLARYGPGAAASTQAFTTLTLGQLLHTYSARSDTRGLFSGGRQPPNRYLTWAMGGSLAAQLAAGAVPGMRKLLGTTPLGPTDLLVTAAGAGLPFLVNETLKAIRQKTPDSETTGRTDAETAAGGATPEPEPASESQQGAEP